MGEYRCTGKYPIFSVRSNRTYWSRDVCRLQNKVVFLATVNPSLLAGNPDHDTKQVYNEKPFVVYRRNKNLKDISHKTSSRD